MQSMRVKLRRTVLSAESAAQQSPGRRRSAASRSPGMGTKANQALKGHRACFASSGLHINPILNPGLKSHLRVLFNPGLCCPAPSALRECGSA
jgi:hypothetical protein